MRNLVKLLTITIILLTIFSCGKPAKFNKDGSHKGLVKYIKDSMNDPESFEHVASNHAINEDNQLVVRMGFRGRNSFNAKVINVVDAFINVETDEIILVRKSTP